MTRGTPKKNWETLQSAQGFHRHHRLLCPNIQSGLKKKKDTFLREDRLFY